MYDVGVEEKAGKIISFPEAKRAVTVLPGPQDADGFGQFGLGELIIEIKQFMLVKTR